MRVSSAGDGRKVKRSTREKMLVDWVRDGTARMGKSGGVLVDEEEEGTASEDVEGRVLSLRPKFLRKEEAIEVLVVGVVSGGVVGVCIVC